MGIRGMINVFESFSCFAIIVMDVFNLPSPLSIIFDNLNFWVSGISGGERNESLCNNSNCSSSELLYSSNTAAPFRAIKSIFIWEFCFASFRKFLHSQFDIPSFNSTIKKMCALEVGIRIFLLEM